MQQSERDNSRYCPYPGITPETIAYIKNKAEVSVIGPKELTKEDLNGFTQLDLTDGYGLTNNKIYHQTQRMAVTGPVCILLDYKREARHIALRRLEVPPLDLLPVCVSVAAINFYSSAADSARFVNRRINEPNESGRKRMKMIWHHACHQWNKFGVRVPVVSAVGCDALRGTVHNVAKHWVEALVWVLSHYAFENFRFVVLSVPTFSNDERYTLFVKTFEENKLNLKVPVVLTATQSMISLAKTVEKNLRLRAGILNMSNVLALRTGKMGMNWNVILSEVCFVVVFSTTLQTDVLEPLLRRK